MIKETTYSMLTTITGGILAMPSKYPDKAKCIRRYLSNKANKNNAKWIGLVHMLGVDPAYRQQEIGKSVLLNGLEDLKAKGIDIVELTVDSENPAACSLYESVGFEVIARLTWYEKLVA